MSEESKGGDSIREGLARMAAATGTPLPDGGRKVPQVNIGQPLASLSREVGQVLMSAPLFRRGEAFVTVNAETGEEQPLTANRFRSWHQRFFLFAKGDGDKRELVNTLPHDKAVCVLASDELRACVRELKAVNTVRVPIWRGEGRGRELDLLPSGYDAESKTFTVDLLPYALEMPLAAALAWFRETFGGFPFYESGDLLARRSFAAHVAAMLGVYAVNLLPPASVRPMIIYNGNMPGVGKSLLGRMSLAPVHGVTEEDCKPKNDEELRNVLDAVALAGRPYLFLDDAANLKSQDLNRFVTSPAHVPRVKGLSIRVHCPNVTQVFATGNGLNVTADLDRRALVVDLFDAQGAAEREVKNPHTNESVFAPTYRAGACAALWSILSHWSKAGSAALPEARKPSFEAYAALVGSAVVAAGLANPFGQRECVRGGDESGRALQDALSVLAGEIEDDAQEELTTDDVLAVLRKSETLDVVVPWAKNEKGEKQSLGHKLASMLGRELTDSRGRVFAFSRRNAARGAAYPILFVKAR